MSRPGRHRTAGTGGMIAECCELVVRGAGMSLPIHAAIVPEERPGAVSFAKRHHQLHGGGDQLTFGGHSELLFDAFAVGQHGGPADAQRRGNLPGLGRLHQQAEDAQFAVAESIPSPAGIPAPATMRWVHPRLCR
jgi:hypothetical protein